MGMFVKAMLVGIGLPFIILQTSIPEPPVRITGWLVFIAAFAAAVGLVNALFTKAVWRPMIENELKKLPTRIEFDTHQADDNIFQEEAREFQQSTIEFRGRMNQFLDDYYAGDSRDQRHKARRKGDPQ